MTPRDPRVFFNFLFSHYLSPVVSTKPSLHLSLHLIMSEAVLAPVKALSNAVNNMSIKEYRDRKVALITGKHLGVSYAG
jgi:hypothetical protein